LIKSIMKKSYRWALFYSIIAISFMIWGVVSKIDTYLYGAILLAVVSFYWMFRDKMITTAR
jgi:hypothetical protein